jgi:predicted metal-binding membrane protein
VAGLRPPVISSAARRPRDIATVALVGAAAWVGVLWLVHGSAMSMGPTMGLSAVGFLGAWTLMMAAMMLPLVAPVAALYVRTFQPPARLRLAEFALGYLLVWAAIGVPAFGVAVAVQAVSMSAPWALRWVVVGVLLAVAVYQLTPLKQLCLKHCRSPLSQLLHYAAHQGRLRDLRVGAHHGLYCAGCCWSLFLLLVAVGTMNLGVMLTLAAVVAAEKLLPHGFAISRAVAAIAVALAVAFAVSPALLTRVIGS